MPFAETRASALFSIEVKASSEANLAWTIQEQPPRSWLDLSQIFPCARHGLAGPLTASPLDNIRSHSRKMNGMQRIGLLRLSEPSRSKDCHWLRLDMCRNNPLTAFLILL